MLTCIYVCTVHLLLDAARGTCAQGGEGGEGGGGGAGGGGGRDEEPGLWQIQSRTGAVEP
jgi:hypothetical protein